MPISLVDLRDDRSTVTVKTKQGDVEVVYRPNAMTPMRQAELERLAGAVADDDDREARDNAMVLMFCEVVESVDISGPIVGADGTELVAAGALIPVEPDYVAYIPGRFINLTFAAIAAQLREEDEEYSKSSETGSRSNGRPIRTASRRGSSTR